MGLCRQDIELLTEFDFLVKDKSVIALGNPFFERSTLHKLVPRDEINICFKLDKLRRAKWLFKDYMGAKEFLVLDVSKDEGADIVHDMNSELPSHCVGRYDIVLDCGTQEHVFDNNIFLRNVFRMLSVNGYYYFNVPASGMLEHGFRQYSPTFFYDLCQKNKKMIKLAYLSLFYPPNSIGVNLFDLYRKLDLSNYDETVSPINATKQKNYSYGIFTGMMVRLHNIEPKPSALLGLIKKSSSGELSFVITQCLYRTYSLKSMTSTQSRKDQVVPKTFVNEVLKALILRSPLPVVIKGAFLRCFIKYIQKMK